MRSSVNATFLLALILLGSAFAWGGHPVSRVYRAGPDIRTAPPQPAANYAAFGVRLADVSGDGLADLVVSNGHDHLPQPLTVYFGTANGFPRSPDWLSEAFGHYRGLAVGDVNGDEHLDVAVARAFGRLREAAGGGVEVFLGDPATGRLAAKPAFDHSGFDGSGVTFADVDADGDLDLVVAVQREATDEIPGKGRVFLNVHGTLTPSGWQPHGFGGRDVVASDFDDDGWIDLAFVASVTEDDAEKGRVVVFFGSETTPDQAPFSETPDWATDDLGRDAWSLDVTPVGEDRRPALVVASSSGLRAFRPNRSGDRSLVFENRRQTSAFGLLAADVDGDGLADLVTSQLSHRKRFGQDICVRPGDRVAFPKYCFGGPIRIFPGTRTGFARRSAWESEIDGLIPRFAVADCRKRGLLPRSIEVPAAARRAVITLPERRIEAILEVEVDGRPRAWLAPPGEGWLSLTPPMEPGSVATVRYQISNVLDLAAANSSPLDGNWVFIHPPPHKRME